MPTPDRLVDGDSADRLDPIPFQFNDIRALAQKILKRAQEQGQAKIEAARKQVAAMEKQAYDKAYKEAFPKGEQDGFAKGEKDGMAAAEKRIAESVDKELGTLRESCEPVKNILEQIANIMNENRQALIAQAEADLLLLALDIAKRLVGHELSFNPECIRPIAMEAISLVTDRSAVTVRVCPDDFAVMEKVVPEIKTMFPDAGSIRVEADASLEHGSLMAATRESEVDLRLATRLAAFEEAILGYSGKDAVAPWSSLPPEAFAAVNTQESSFSLPPAEPAEQEQQNQNPDSADADQSAPEQDSAPPPPETQSESEATPQAEPEQDNASQQTEQDAPPPAEPAAGEA